MRELLDTRVPEGGLNAINDPDVLANMAAITRIVDVYTKAEEFLEQCMGQYVIAIRDPVLKENEQFRFEDDW